MSSLLKRLCLLTVFITLAPVTRADTLPKDVTDAINQLPTSDAPTRQKIYATLADKADARVIPLLKAYRDGSLLFINNTFVIYGERVTIPGQGAVLPQVNALTGEPFKGPDGLALYKPKIDLSQALKQPPRPERPLITELISGLSLLAPDKETRLASIHDAGEKANRAFTATAADRDKITDELTKLAPVLQKQLDKEPTGPYAVALKEAVASINLAVGDRPTQIKSAQTLGQIGSMRAQTVLRRWLETVHAKGDAELERAGTDATAKAESYQSKIQWVQNTFAGLSLGSILVLLALGLSIVFGLMGVINMAHGEFMMVGAFTTYQVSFWFKQAAPGWYDWYLLAAIPAAFLVSALVGYVCEAIVIRRLYGRPLDTLLATWGIGLILVWRVRKSYGDTLSVAPPKWMEGGVEVATDLVFPLNRVYIMLFCAICIVATYLIVNRTKFGLLLRATTQNREMAAALGVPTRRMDGLTFALGCGLAGLAGVAVPLYNKINPNIGQEYIVDSFMVVVVGGVGKLAGAIIAGFGVGFISKYLEPLFQHVSFLKSGASVIGKVVVLGLVILFLQRRPDGLFPPKGRQADA